MCDHCGCESPPKSEQSSTLKIEQDLLSTNQRVAEHNRAMLQAQETMAFNLISSPGAGKTSLLVETLYRLGERHTMVIEGDQQTELDAERIRATGVPAIQIQTEQACHLDARPIHHALHQLPLEPGGLLFIENVGNLICPSYFDLGEHLRIALLSVTEGEEKPLKYPNLFHHADLLLLTKTDLLPHLDFDLQQCLDNVRRINPGLPVIELSARTGTGMDNWLAWVERSAACALQSPA